MEPISGIAVDIPDKVKFGESARLFPVLSDSSREGRATSVFLATLSVVDTLADALLRRLGRPIGKRSKVKCLTEVVLKSDPHFRPDGLIVVDSGQDTWSALVECKIGKARIDQEQLENYIKKARESGIDCVITISNELVADPRRPPTPVDGHLTKTVGHFHYSWLAIRSEAEIAYTQSLVSDPEKKFILREFIRFLSHASTGVEGFTQMPAEWPDIVAEFSAGRAPTRRDPRLLEVVDAWLQEEKEIALMLSRLVSRRCTSRSERKFRYGDYDPASQILTDLADHQSLIGAFAVPDAASDIDVIADLHGRSTRISMTLRAPEDRKKPEARLNWLLSQLKTVDPKDIEIVVHWPGRLKPTHGPLADLREDPKRVVEPNRQHTPYAFEVSQCCHKTPAAFIGRRRFIQELEAAIQSFYGEIGSKLTAWSPKPPPPTEKSAADQIEADTQIDPERLSAVERSLAKVIASLGSSAVAPPPAAGTAGSQTPAPAAASDAPEGTLKLNS
jgi:hypothetical protein